MEDLRTISVVTRLNIFDTIRVEGVAWSGRLPEDDFLARLFDLQSLPSDDGRFENASGDIWQHRINNLDWEEHWVFTDKRFKLLHGPDDVFLRFLCEMLHPVVRDNREEVVQLRQVFNQHLKADGWELYERTSISGKPVYSARRLLADSRTVMQAVQAVASVLNAEYVSQQITRMETALNDDPELAIGTAKEFVETLCKTILDDLGVAHDAALEFPKLVRLTLKELELVPDQIAAQARGADTIRVLLNNLASISNGLAEIRNLYGTGHGKHARSRGLQRRHARLAVGTASTLGVFLFETYQEKSK
jgi:hypothetical protein